MTIAALCMGMGGMTAPLMRWLVIAVVDFLVLWSRGRRRTEGGRRLFSWMKRTTTAVFTAPKADEFFFLRIGT